MKASVVALGVFAALASATPGAIPPGVLINCAKPNANYCMAEDIILRCDGSSLGVRGRCSDNLFGYPPAGGVASCYQSSLEAGDAACQKNCVVHAAQPFTLPADKCTPSATMIPSYPESTSTSERTSTGTASKPISSTWPTVSMTSETGIFSIPEGTSLGTAPTVKPTGSSSSHTEPGECPVPTTIQTTMSGSQPTTTAAASTTGTSAVPTAAANVNQAAGVLVAAGVFAALLF